MQGRLDRSLYFKCWVSSSASQDKKLLKESALSRGQEVSSIPFPQLRNSFCWVARKVTYIIYGQKTELACFWMTGYRTKAPKKILTFPSWPQNENLPLCWHLLHGYCVIWFCSGSWNWHYLYVTVIQLCMGCLIENASMSQFSFAWKYVPQCLSPGLHRDLFFFPPLHCSLLCPCILGEKMVHSPSNLCLLGLGGSQCCRQLIRTGLHGQQADPRSDLSPWGSWFFVVLAVELETPPRYQPNTVPSAALIQACASISMSFWTCLEVIHGSVSVSVWDRQDKLHSAEISVKITQLFSWRLFRRDGIQELPAYSWPVLNSTLKIHQILALCIFCTDRLKAFGLCKWRHVTTSRRGILWWKAGRAIPLAVSKACMGLIPGYKL